VGLAVLGTPKSIDQVLDRRPRGHFPFFMAADSIRHGKHPPVRARLRGTRGDIVANIVFIVIANAPDIGSFHEFYVKHMTGEGQFI
jgi:hypothetical protein